MEYPFDALHAGIESQILNLPAGIPDSQAVRQAKASPDSVEKFPVSYTHLTLPTIWHV